MSARETPATTPPLTTDELRLLAGRERERLAKQERRARSATERATAAQPPNAKGYVVPMPSGLPAFRKWLRLAHDAYSRRVVGFERRRPLPRRGRPDCAAYDVPAPYRLTPEELQSATDHCRAGA